MVLGLGVLGFRGLGFRGFGVRKKEALLNRSVQEQSNTCKAMQARQPCVV